MPRSRAFEKRKDEGVFREGGAMRVAEANGGVWWPTNRRVRKPTGMTIDVVIPALNEEESLPRVLADIPQKWVRRVVVVDNGSSDRTAACGTENGAVVVSELRRGYGSACLKGIASLRADPPNVVVFLDADYSDYPEEIPRLLDPIVRGEAELVIGSRTIGSRDRGALLPQAIFGNKLACALIEVLYGYRYTDLGPFRAITWAALERLQMKDPDFGWTVEMQVKAAKLGISSVEVPVSYRRRIGHSKISGTIQGSVRAGEKILRTIFLQGLGR
jgi:glycosyltransferase involved in cell wall biosynthesis